MIDPERIRRDLEAVWISLGQKSAEDAGVMRACALTLITVVDDGDDDAVLAQTLAELMRVHPSRAIVVRLAPGDADLLEAGVEAQCWMPFGGRQQICSEQIVIRCTDRTLAEAPGVVLPLVAADLPVVLWCPSDRAWRSPSFPALAEPAGRVIVDTSRAANPAGALRTLYEQYQGGGGRLADLSWTHLTRWRALVAQLFENAFYRRLIPHLAAATIDYEGAAESPLPATALLMAGWLGSRLGWPDDGRVRFRRVEARFGAGRLAAVGLEAPRACITIARTDRACGEVRAEVAGAEPLLKRVELAPSDDARLLSEELGIHGPDTVFGMSLARAASGHEVP